MSRKTRWSRSRTIDCITEELDFTSRTAIKHSISRIKNKYDALWLSCPCTGGSSWVHINWYRGEGVRQKIREHWDLFIGFGLLSRRSLNMPSRWALVYLSSGHGDVLTGRSRGLRSSWPYLPHHGLRLWSKDALMDLLFLTAQRRGSTSPRRGD